MDSQNNVWSEYRLRELLGRGRAFFLGGAVVSLLGFALPWFKWGERAQWWYSGWQLMAEEGVGWIGLLLVVYMVLIGGGYFMVGRGPNLAAVAVLLTLALVLGTMVVVSIAAADAVEEIRTADGVVWSFGLLILIAGHAVMLWGVLSTWVLQLIRDVLGIGEEERAAEA